MDNDDRDSIQFYYRYHVLKLDVEQTLLMERWFSVQRMISNHLFSLTQHLLNSDAIAHKWTVEAAMAEALMVMNKSDNEIFDHVTPVILRSIVVAWVSEWEDYRNNRIRRPEFKSHRDEQTLWFLDKDCIDYKETQFLLNGSDAAPIQLPASRIEVPRKATAFMCGRTKNGSYVFASLHERMCREVHEKQDMEATRWGKRIVLIEQELREHRRRYKDPSHPKVKAAEDLILTLRKIILHRILRQREEKINSSVVPFPKAVNF